MLRESAVASVNREAQSIPFIMIPPLFVNGNNEYFYLTPAITWLPNEAQWFNEVKNTFYIRFYGSSSNPLKFYVAQYKDTGHVYHGGITISTNTNTSVKWHNYYGINNIYNPGTSSNEWTSYDTRS